MLCLHVGMFAGYHFFPWLHTGLPLACRWCWYTTQHGLLPEMLDVGALKLLCLFDCLILLHVVQQDFGLAKGGCVKGVSKLACCRIMVVPDELIYRLVAAQ